MASEENEMETTVSKVSSSEPDRLPRQRRTRKPRSLKKILILPVLIVMLVLVGFPLLFELYLSFTGWQANMGNWWEASWYGGGNYVELFLDDRFILAVLRTFLIVAIAMAIESVLGLGLALLFVDDFKGKRFFTSLFLTPMMVIPLVAGFVFFMLFQEAGPLNSILSAVSGKEVLIPWLTNARTAFPAVIVADVWQWTPLMFLIFLSGLLAIPREINDAAYALGTTPWQRFRYITLPLLRPVIVIALIIRGIELVKIFDTVFILTKGGPGTSTEVISTYLYEVGFRYFRLALTAAAAFVVLAIITVIAMQAVKPLRAAEAKGEQG